MKKNRSKGAMENTKTDVHNEEGSSASVKNDEELSEEVVSDGEGRPEKETAEARHEKELTRRQLRQLVEALTAENESLIKEVQSQVSAVEALTNKADGYLGKLTGLKGDYERLKARSTAAVENAKAEGKAETIEKLVPVLDTFDRARASVTDEKSLAAFDLIVRQFEKLMEDAGVTEVEVMGNVFDPNIANAVIKQPVEDEALKGVVIGVVTKGYRHGDKIIKYPQVVVGV